MSITDKNERLCLGSGLLALGASLTALGTALGVVSVEHMIASANICGENGVHCLTCVGTVACLAAALITVRAGWSLLRPDRLVEASGQV